MRYSVAPSNGVQDSNGFDPGSASFVAMPGYRSGRSDVSGSVPDVLVV